MNPHGYEQWLESYRQGPVPDGFSDRVMGAIEEVPPAPPQPSAGVQYLAAMALRLALSLAGPCAVIWRFWHLLSVP